jgi:MFS transporter, ACS family, glucarate transporter
MQAKPCSIGLGFFFHAEVLGRRISGRVIISPIACPHWLNSKMNRDLSVSVAARTPTRVRFGVLAFACSLSMITYLDRVCIGSAAHFLWTELGGSSIEDIGAALTAFSVSYAIFEIPSGWLGDMYGPRRVLIRIVLVWSVFTALTGFTTSMSIAGVQFGLWTLILVRFLFGAGEAGAYPNITRALHNWFPFGERGFAQGMVWMAGRLMGGLTPLLWLFLVEGVRQTSVLDTGETSTRTLLQPIFNWPGSWRSCFWLFGLVGVAWCILFALWFRNRPSEKQTVNDAERELIESGRTQEEEVAHRGVPWLLLLKSRNLWALCLMYFCASYAWYFNLNYLPTYMEEQRGVPSGDLIGALYKGGPLWMGAMACILGGWLTDRFIRRTGNRKWGRRSFGLIGHGMCGVCYLACLVAPSALTFFLAISFAAFFNDLTMGAAWATCQDIGKRYAAIVAGCMNTVGNLGGALGTYVTAQVLRGYVTAYETSNDLSKGALKKMAESSDIQTRMAALNQLREAHMPGYQTNLLIFAGVYFAAMLLWMGVDATRPVAEDA